MELRVPLNTGRVDAELRMHVVVASQVLIVREVVASTHEVGEPNRLRFAGDEVDVRADQRHRPGGVDRISDGHRDFGRSSDGGVSVVAELELDAGNMLARMGETRRVMHQSGDLGGDAGQGVTHRTRVGIAWMEVQHETATRHW